MPASYHSVDDLKKPVVTCVLTRDELKTFRIIAAQKDTPVKILAEGILKAWIRGNMEAKA